MRHIVYQKILNLFSRQYDALFKSARVYKKQGWIKGKQAKKRTIIKTKVSWGHVETINVAQPGDWIVTNLGGEQYVISFKRFHSLYEHMTNRKGYYAPKGNPVKGIQTDKNIVFTAPWGEEQFMNMGDWLVDNGTERYGIGFFEFIDTYVPTPQ